VLDSWRTSVDDWGSVDQARDLGLLNNWGLVPMVHQGGLLDSNRFHLSLVVVFLYIIVQIQSHHMWSWCLWRVVYLGPDWRFRNYNVRPNKGCFGRVYKWCFGHRKP